MERKALTECGQSTISYCSAVEKNMICIKNKCSKRNVNVFLLKISFEYTLGYFRQIVKTNAFVCRPPFFCLCMPYVK